jgi:hypothetical protein
MSSDSLKEHRERSLLPSNRSLAVGAAILVAVVVVAGAAMMVLSDDGDVDGETGAQLDSLPQGTDGVVYLDGNATEDELVREFVDDGMANGWWLANEGVAPNATEVFAALNTSAINYRGITAFYQYQEETYAGAVVEVDNAERVVDFIELEVGDLEETEHEGVTVYNINPNRTERSSRSTQYNLIDIIGEFIGSETEIQLATLDDGTVVLGSQPAVEDAIDVEEGIAEPLSEDSDLHTAHRRAESGPIEATINTTPLNTVELASVLNDQISAGIDLVRTSGGEVQLVSMSYNVADREQGTIRFDVQATMRESEGAKDLMNMLNTRVENPDEINNDTPEQIRRVGATKRIKGSRDGRYVDIVVPEIPDTVAGYVANYVDKFGPPTEPRTLVPQQANNWTEVSVDNDALGNLTGLGIEIDSAVTFSRDGEEYAGTVVRMTDASSGDSEFFINKLEDEIAVEFPDQSTTFNHRENTFGYRDVDIFEADLPEQPAVTAALSSSTQGTPDWFALGDDQTIIFGTEEAVKDSIDIYRGAAAPNPDAAR